MHEHVCAWLDGLGFTYGGAGSAVGWSGSRHKSGAILHRPSSKRLSVSNGQVFTVTAP